MKYRILQVSEKTYEVQYRPWWFPFWMDVATFWDFDEACRLVKHLRKPFKPVVLDV